MRITLGFKALISLAGGLVITFSQSKSPGQVLHVLAAYAIGHVVLLGIGVLAKLKREELLAQLPMATFATIIAVIASLGNSNEPPMYDKVHWLIITWGLISGAFGIWQVRRVGVDSRAGKDWGISASLVLALAAGFLMFPNLDIITTEGFFGAFLVIDGVHLALAATGPRNESVQSASDAS